MPTTFGDQRLFYGRREKATRGNEEGAAAHRGIGNPQREDLFRRPVSYQRRQGGPDEIRGQPARCVERAT